MVQERGLMPLTRRQSKEEQRSAKAQAKRAAVRARCRECWCPHGKFDAETCRYFLCTCHDKED